MKKYSQILPIIIGVFLSMLINKFEKEYAVVAFIGDIMFNIILIAFPLLFIFLYRINKKITYYQKNGMDIPKELLGDYPAGHKFNIIELEVAGFVSLLIGLILALLIAFHFWTKFNP